MNSKAKPILVTYLASIESGRTVECQKVSPGIERLDKGLRLIVESFTPRTKTRYLPPR